MSTNKNTTEKNFINLVDKASRIGLGLAFGSIIIMLMIQLIKQGV